MGMQSSLNRLEKGRIKLLNILVFILIASCLILTIITILQGLIIQPIATSLGAILLSFNYYLIYKEKHKAARIYFVGIGSLLVIVVSLFAYKQGLYTETENILFAFMANCMLLFNGSARHRRYWILFACIIILKYIRQDFMAQPYELPFYLLIQNVTILGVLMYLFLLYFYQTLTKSIEDLLASEQTLYSTIDNISPFIALINPDGTYKVVNKQYEKGFKIPRDEIIGKTAHEIMPEYLADGQQRVFNEALQSGKQVEFKEGHEMPDGSMNVGQGKFTPIKDKEGNILAIAGYVNNISELEETKRKLEEVNKSKDRIFSIVTHDIKSPLNMFESMLNASRDRVITSENFEELIDQLISKFAPIKSTIADLLKWSQSNLQNIDIKKADFKAMQIIEEVISISQMIADQKGIDILFEGNDQVIHMDSEHLKIAVRNILQNAIKFSDENTSITIQQYVKNQTLHISITDSGVGITENKLAQIRQGISVQPGKGTIGEVGSGLGLSLVNELLIKNSCSLEIQSQIGKGSTFTIVTPIK